MTVWTIRPAEPRDEDEVSDVLTEAGLGAWAPFLGADRVEQALRGRRQGANLVAVDDEGVVGFVGFSATDGEIQRLFVHPRGQGIGIGTELLGRALDELRAAGLSQAWLNTEIRNEGAVAFYESRGWKRDGPDRVRDWHGAELREPRFVHDL